MSRNNLKDHERNRILDINSNRDSQKIWRDEKILRLDSLGYSQSDIAKQMQLSQPQISKIIAALTKQARQDIESHIEETLPYQKRKAIELLNEMKRQAVEISSKGDDSIGNRDRIAAIGLISDIQLKIYAIETDGRLIRDALQVTAKLRNKLQGLESLQQQNQQDSIQDEQQQGETAEELRFYNDSATGDYNTNDEETKL